MSIEKYLFFGDYNRKELSLAYSALTGQTIKRVKYADFYEHNPQEVYKVLNCDKLNAFIALQSMHGKKTAIVRLKNKELHLSSFEKGKKFITIDKRKYSYNEKTDRFEYSSATYVVLFGGLYEYVSRFNIQQNIATIIAKYYIWSSSS